MSGWQNVNIRLLTNLNHARKKRERGRESVCGWERERDRETETESSQRETEWETESSERGSVRERERGREGDRQTDRQRKRERTKERERERERRLPGHSLMLGCPAHIRRMLTSRMVSDLVCSMAAASDVFSPLMSMIFTAYSLCVAFSTTRRTVLLMPLPHTTSHTGHTMFQLLTLSNTSLLVPLPHTTSHTGHTMFQLLTLSNTSLLTPLPHTTSHTGHTMFQLLTLSNTSLLTPLPHTSHTGHTMFQLLTLSNTSLLTPLPVPHSNATHRSPQVSTVHTHFKQHQFAHAPTTQQCLPYTGHPTFQLLTLTHVNQHQSADARASTVPNSNVHHTQVTPCFNCSH